MANQKLTPRHWVILVASSLTVMAGATVAPALPEIQSHFTGAWKAELLTKLIITIPGLFIALFSPLVGIVLDRYGRLKMLFAGIVLYAVSGVSAFFLNDLVSIVISRCFLGISVAAIMTTAITLIGDYYDG